ncbi:MAG: hypothetical protein RRY80_07325 [Lachnospiraceae bacterium]
MKKTINKLGFRKMDEMEKNIALKSQRIALVYVIIALLIWSFYETYKVYAYQTTLNILPCFLLVSTSWVLIISQLLLKKKAVKDDSDYQHENPTWKFIVIIILIVGLIVALGSFILVSGIFS